MIFRVVLAVTGLHTAPDDLTSRDPPPAKYKRILYTGDDFYKIVTLREININVQKLQITNRKIKAIATRCFRAHFFGGLL